MVLCTLLRALVGERPVELEDVSSGGMLRVVTTCVTVFEKKTSSRWVNDVKYGQYHANIGGVNLRSPMPGLDVISSAAHLLVCSRSRRQSEGRPSCSAAATVGCSPGCPC
jgi:hypothetical protein